MGLFSGTFKSSAIAGAATNGVINNSYVSKRKPMLAMTMISQVVVVNLGVGIGSYGRVYGCLQLFTVDDSGF